MPTRCPTPPISSKMKRTVSSTRPPSCLLFLKQTFFLTFFVAFVFYSLESLSMMERERILNERYNENKKAKERIEFRNRLKESSNKAAATASAFFLSPLITDFDVGNNLLVF
jgi:hypothetical protein